MCNFCFHTLDLSFHVVVIAWWLDLHLSVKIVPITTEVVSSNPAQGEVHSIQHYVIKFVSDLPQVMSFFRVFRIPPPIKLTTMIYLKYC